MPPINDDYADATDLASDISGSVAGTNVDATTEDDEPQILNDDSYPLGENGLYSVWWKWQAPGGTTLGDWLATDGANSGNYMGAWLRLFRLTTTVDIPADAIWSPPAQPSDQRTDATGFTVEADLFVGYPGLISQDGYGSTFQPWDHNGDRYVLSTWLQSDGTVNTQTPGGGQANWWSGGDDNTIPAGTDVWIIAVQWPDGHNTPLPLDAVLDWDPTADMGTWTHSDGVTPLVPWDLSTMVEQPIGPMRPSMMFNTFGSQTTDSHTLDTILDIWTHVTDSDWDFIAGNDDDSGGGDPDNDESGGTTSRTDFVPIGGVEYLIRVTSYDPTQSGPIMLSWNYTNAPPANDEITAAILIPASSVTGTSGADNTNATASETFGYTGAGHSVWWKWEPLVDCTMELTAPGSDTPTAVRIDVYSSSGAVTDTGSSLTPVAGDGDDSAAPDVSFDATAGETYFIRVDSMTADEVGIIILSWSVTVTPPANDNRADAVVMAGDSGTETYTTFGGTQEDDEPNGVDSLIGWLLSVWYSWSPAFDGSALLSADSDTYIEVFSLDGGDPATASWTELTHIGGGLASAIVGIRADETFAIRLYPINSDAPSIAAAFHYATAAGGGGGGGIGVSTGDIAVTLPVLTIDTPGVLNLSIIDEAPGEEILITVDGDPTVLVDDLIDDDGTWDGGVPVGELTDGDHYVTVTAGSRVGTVGFGVANDVTYFSDPADPASPTLPTITDGEWVAP